MNTMLKLVQLYKLITEATDEEISILLGYAQNLQDSRPKDLSVQEAKEIGG